MKFVELWPWVVQLPRTIQGPIAVICSTYNSYCCWKLWPWLLQLPGSRSHLLKLYIDLNIEQTFFLTFKMKNIHICIYKPCPLSPIYNLTICKTVFVFFAIFEIINVKTILYQVWKHCILLTNMKLQSENLSWPPWMIFLTTLLSYTWMAW